MKKVFSYAENFIGASEISAPNQHNSTIVKWLQGVMSWVNDDETPWCAAFSNAMLEECGIKGTGKPNARSFLKWGEETYTPEKGDVVVFWRSSIDSWKGHVAFFDSFKTKNGQMGVIVLGGNQSDKVSKAWYPLGRVLAYRTIK